MVLRALRILVIIRVGKSKKKYVVAAEIFSAVLFYEYLLCRWTRLLGKLSDSVFDSPKRWMLGRAEKISRKRLWGQRVMSLHPVNLIKLWRVPEYSSPRDTDAGTIETGIGEVQQTAEWSNDDLNPTREPCARKHPIGIIAEIVQKVMINVQTHSPPFVG